MDQNTHTILGIVARPSGSERAIGAPDRDWMTHAELYDLCARTGSDLNGFGLGRNDRIAIVAPNGPIMAAAFMAIAAYATAAPLNPGYKRGEFEFFLTDLNAKALVIPAGFASPARAVADMLSIPMIELVADRAKAGVFTLQSLSPLPPDTAFSPGDAQPVDIALVLNTSGTTARPKIVPLTQANVTASAENMAATLQLIPADTCLNIMPLFHIHGLIAAVLTSIAAGGSIACAPGLDGTKFFGWPRRFQPS
jgi:acyl-CoA synthetase (AMP-forming)/AMP-acid ligase II